MHILFGVVDYEGWDLKNIYDKEIIDKFGYAEIFSKYSDPLLTEAQNYLQSLVVSQLKKLNLKDVIEKRRLTNTDEFVEYVKEFLEQLEEGPMRKRLPKNKNADMNLKKKS